MSALTDLLKDPTGAGAITANVTKLVGMFFPDKSQEERDRMTLMLTTIQGQLDANKAEATNPSRFVAGWRPAVGWVCVAALGMSFIPKAVVLTVLWTWQAAVIVSSWHGSGVPPVLPAYPDLGVTDLIGLLVSLLGIGTMRSIDKIAGKSTVAFAKPDPATPDQGGTPN